MKRISFFLIVMVMITFTQWSFTVAADGISERGLYKLLRSKILMAKGIAANDLLVESVVAQNALKRSLADIQALDHQWRNEPVDSALKLDHQNNPSGAYIKDVLESDPDMFSEIFITDNQGANVATYPATSDYWQGDEDKWINAWADGRGKVFLDKMALDESSGFHSIQISVPVKDSATTVGVLVVGIKLTYIQSSYLLKNLDKRLIEAP